MIRAGVGDQGWVGDQGCGLIRGRFGAGEKAGGSPLVDPGPQDL